MWENIKKGKFDSQLKNFICFIKKESEKKMIQKIDCYFLLLEGKHNFKKYELGDALGEPYDKIKIMRYERLLVQYFKDQILTPLNMISSNFYSPGKGEGLNAKTILV